MARRAGFVGRGSYAPPPDVCGAATIAPRDLLLLLLLLPAVLQVSCVLWLEPPQLTRTDAVAAEAAAKDAPADAPGGDGGRGEAGSGDAPVDRKTADLKPPDLKVPPPVTHRWSKRFGGQDFYAESGHSVAVDASGNVTVTGEIEGAADFGGGTLPGAGGPDLFVASYGLTGAHRWSKRLGSTGYFDGGFGVAVDASANVFITGAFEGTVGFGGGAALVSAGRRDLFVASYSSTGQHRWSQRLGGAEEDWGVGVTVDGKGIVTVAGRCEVVNFSPGGGGIMISSLGPTGVTRSSKCYPGSPSNGAAAVGADPSGNATVTGTLAGTADFGGGPRTSVAADIVLASYDASGAHRWSKLPAAGQGLGLAVDASGNITITGSFSGSVDLGGGTLTSAGGLDLFVASYTTAGAHRWSKRFGGSGADQGRAVAVDAAGNVIITGDFTGTTDFGGGVLASAGATDIFVASFGPTGAYRWSTRFGGTASDSGQGVAVDSSGNVTVTGAFMGAVDFGSGALTSAGSTDVFIVQFKP